jgi:MoaA/NifB/PqqE/SkfB family radical SAM enzyme
VHVDEQGRLVLPPDLTARLGLVEDASVRIEEHADSFTVSRSTASLAKVYVEPTNVCNLHCSMCVRNVWDERPGMMSRATFTRIMEGVERVSPRPTLFFGGFGEPFAHPQFLTMLAAAKAAAGAVELITNGTALDENACRELVRIGVDRVWVSIDGATPESYADVRLWDALPQVTANLGRLRQLRLVTRSGLPRLGIAFVAMKRNIADLAEVVRLGKRLGADRFSISNVLPHTPEMRDQALYEKSISSGGGENDPSPWAPQIALPRLDLDEGTVPHLARIAASRQGLPPWGQTGGSGAGSCPFVEKGSLSIRWDGEVSPCLPLLHTHRSYLDFRLRTSHAFSIGNINGRDLLDLWTDPAYVALRERLQIFDFAPCVTCNSCDMADENLEDCYGSPTPTCGGCLWAQGFIQCP